MKTRSLSYFWGIFFTALLLGCAAKKEFTTQATPDPPVEASSQTKKDSTFLIYQRTPCFGMCPYFNLTVYQSGYCVYEGKNFVDMVGFYHTNVDTSVLQNIMKTAESIQYFSLADSYDNPNVTDLPTTTTGIMKGDSLKIVAARYKSPKELQVLYQVLDEMIEGATWTSMAEKKMQN